MYDILDIEINEYNNISITKAVLIVHNVLT